jgi:hypothetical protein
MKKCHVCKKELNIRLMPDFTSSGMWCSECGVCFANPKETFPFIPKGLVDLIQGWNDFWDLCSCNYSQINITYHNELIQSMGIELAKQLSVYCDCWFDETCSKISTIPEFNH